MPPSTPIETIWEIWASPGSTPPSTHLGNLGVTREHPAPATPEQAPSTSRIENRPTNSNRCHRAQPTGNLGVTREHPAPATSNLYRPPTPPTTDATDTDRNHLGNLGVTREHPAPATPAEAPSTSRIEHRPPISNRCHRAPISNRRHRAQPTPPSRSATDATE